MSLWTTLSNFISALASGLGLLRDRSQAANAPTVVAAAQGQDDQKLRDQVAQDLQRRELDALRKLL